MFSRLPPQYWLFTGSQGDQLNMAVFFLYFVEGDLLKGQYGFFQFLICCSEYWDTTEYR